MIKKITQVFLIITTAMLMTGSNYDTTTIKNNETSSYIERISYVETDIRTPVIGPDIVEEIRISLEPEFEKITEVSYESEVKEEETKIQSPLSDSDIDLIALVTMAEAEAEPEYGQRLVIDTILNRMDSEHFPNTASEVIYQKNQFSSMWNGRVKRCYVREDLRQLVIEESITRTNTEVAFFTAGQYGRYGDPMFSVGHHYFSSY